ncbi:MAG: choice-of-anchor D domain-containing protein [Candidatus Nanopelagicales bacterium]
MRTATSTSMLRVAFACAVAAVLTALGVTAANAQSPDPTALSIDAYVNGIAFHDGDFYITNSGKDVVQVYDGVNTVPTRLLSGVAQPWGLAFGTNGNLYVTSKGPNQNDPNPDEVRVFVGNDLTPTPSLTLTGLNDPQGIAVDSADRVYVANLAAGTVSVFDGSTTASATLTGLVEPASVAIGPDGRVYVGTREDTNSIKVFDPGSDHVFNSPSETGTPSAVISGLSSVNAMAFDSDGTFYAANGGTVAVFKAGFIAGQDPPLQGRTLTGIFDPYGIAATADHKVYVADRGDPTGDQTFSLVRTYTPGPAFISDVTPVIFPDTPLGHSAAIEDVEVSNDGTKAMTIADGGVTLATGNAESFSIVSDGCSAAVLEPGDTCLMQVGFSPQSRGNLTTDLHFVDDAISNPHSIPLRGKGTEADLSITPSTNDFGGVTTGSNDEQDFTVRSTGNIPLTFAETPFTKSGPNANQFQIMGDTCSATLPVNDTCTLAVRFAPTSVGNKSATITVASDAPGTKEATATGFGSTAGRSATPTPTNKSFGNILVGNESAQEVITFTNWGTNAIPLGGDPVSVVGASPGQFSLISTTCAASIQVTQSCTAAVTFKPVTPGNLSANLRLVDSANTPMATVALSGTGTQPNISITPANKAFGNTGTNHISTARPFTVTNTGSATLTMGALTVEGTNADQFSVDSDNCSHQALAPAGQCAIVVTFRPTSNGAKSAGLHLVSDAPSTPDVNVTGTGVDPAPHLAAPVTNEFGTVAVDASSATHQLVITNDGTADLTFGAGAVTATGSDPTHFAITADACSNTSVTPDTSCIVTVRFSPTSRGAKAAKIFIVSNDAASPSEISVSGTGAVAPSEPDSVSAAGGAQQVAVSWTVPVDPGEATVTGYAVEVATSASGPFSAAGGTCAPSATTTNSARTCVATGLSDATTYYFRVSATNLAGTGPSTTSNGAKTSVVVVRQVPSRCGAFPRKIKRKGTTTILPRTCRTNGGQTIQVSAKVSRGGKFKLSKKSGGRIDIKTFNKKRMKLTLTFSASARTTASASYLPYSAQKTYKP